jgi:hypothetical protein
MTSHLSRALPLAFVLAFLLQGLFGNLSKSLTWDEPVFMASGYSYLTRNDLRMNSEAPPLLQHLMALPLLTLKLSQVDTTSRVWQKGEHIANGQFFILANAKNLSALTQRARFPSLAIGSLLIFAIYYWGKSLYGRTPALWATALAACSPNLLAHAKLATTDLGCAAFMFFSVAAFWHAVHHASRPAWIFFGFVTGLALLTKYTALLLGPICLLLGLYALWRRIVSFRELVIAGMLVTLTVVLTVGAGYNFSFNPMAYLYGLLKIYANANVGYQFYLMGQVSDQPFWYYHLIAFLIKTPVATVILLGVALCVLLRGSPDREAAIFLLVPAFVVLAVSCFDKSNLGYRRILPALPFLILFASHALCHGPSRVRRRVVVSLFCLSILESLAIFPHHLSFFNAAVGGPSRGPYWLDDSNIDWGQDLPGLADWQKRHASAVPMRQMYFGLLPPRLYGVQAEILPLNSAHIADPQPGYYAISAHQLTWFRKIKAQRDLDIDWLTKYRPIDRIGYSIYLYEFPAAPQN